jgi:hypothetical protein
VTNPNNTEAKIKIRNCVFGFRCAQNWDAMDVYFVENTIKLAEAIGLNRCVAIKPAINEDEPASDRVIISLGMVSSYEETHNDPEPNAAFRKRIRDKKIL